MDEENCEISVDESQKIITIEMVYNVSGNSKNMKLIATEILNNHPEYQDYELYFYMIGYIEKSPYITNFKKLLDI